MATPLPHCLIFPLTVCGQFSIELNFCPGWDLNPEPLNWQSSMLITEPLLTQICKYAIISGRQVNRTATAFDTEWKVLELKYSGCIDTITQVKCLHS